MSQIFVAGRRLANVSAHEARYNMAEPTELARVSTLSYLSSTHLKAHILQFTSAEVPTDLGDCVSRQMQTYLNKPNKSNNSLKSIPQRVRGYSPVGKFS